jgi:DNA helicase HerA-like ATPase
MSAIEITKDLYSVGALDADLDIIDLSSIDNKSIRRLAIGSVLSTCQSRARESWLESLSPECKDDTRVPYFVIVDEAQNVIPNKATNKSELALLEQFRTIAAEGRKYALFLIVVSQRPDKLDELTLSECDNRVIMKLSSKSVLKITKQLLGLDDVRSHSLEKCLNFKTGRALLYGPWVDNKPTFLCSAARRTEEGGKNVDKDFWIQSRIV